jgi:hypothetical protein
MIRAVRAELTGEMPLVMHADNIEWVDRDRLDSIGQRRLDHQMHVASVMRSALDNARKDMAVSLAPVQSLPQRKLIRGA